MLKKYEYLNIEAKIYLFNELKEIFFDKYKNIDLFIRCNKELDLLYDKGLLFIIELLYKYKKYRCEILPIFYHFRGTINNLLLLYVLGIINVDPIKYKLPYELFNDSTITVDLIDAITLDFLSYVNKEYQDKIKFVYGTHEKEEIEEINEFEDNHYLLVPFLGYKESPSCPILKDVSFRLNENLLLETVEDYRKYKDEFLTMRIDEKQPIGNYKEKGLENVLTNDFEKEIAKILKPKTINDYVKVKSIGHGTDVWNYNQDVLVKEGKITLDNLIATLEDIFEYLLNHSIDRNMALEILNFIRKGRPKKDPKKWDKYVKIMKKYNCEDMFIDIFSKILFIFGRGQAVSECLFVLDSVDDISNYSDNMCENKLYGIDINELFCPELEVAYELISKNTDYLKSIPIEDVKDIQFSIRKDIIILLKNGILLFNGEKRLDDIKALAFVDTLEIFSISNERVVTCLTGEDRYKKSFINNNNYQYKKVIQDGVGIYLLTYENTVKFFGTFIKDVINCDNFYNVEDIGYIKENYDIVVMKNGKVYSLFMGHDYSNEKPEIMVDGKFNEVIII